MELCTRCGNEGKTLVIYAVRAGGHSWLPPLDAPPPLPGVEYVCGACLTDHEIMRALSPVVEFALGVLRQGAEPGPTATSLETAWAYFAVRHNDDSSNRPAALRALGL